MVLSPISIRDPEKGAETDMEARTPTDVTKTAERILDRYETFAIVGASPDRGRPSNGVMGVLAEHGFRVIPVNPNADEVRGISCYPDLASIPDDVEVDVVDIFRRSEEAGQHVDEAIAIGAKAVWMQLGVIDEAAAQRARDAGLDVVMDRCPAIELNRRGGRARQGPGRTMLWPDSSPSG